MTSTELALFKDMIKGCVREVIKEELKEALKKDLLDIKKLVAKNIMESRKTVKASPSARMIQETRKYVDSRVEEDEERVSEDIMQGLYEIYGGRGEYERMTKGSSDLIAGGGAMKASDTIPIIGKNPLMNILEETRRGGITPDDVQAFKQGENEIKHQIPTPSRYMPPVEDYDDGDIKNMSIPDFDFSEIARKRLGK